MSMFMMRLINYAYAHDDLRYAYAYDDLCYAYAHEIEDLCCGYVDLTVCG